MAVATPQSFNLIPAEHPRLVGTVKAILRKRRLDLLEELMNAADWGNFCERRGKILGLDEAIAHAEAAEQKLNER